MKDEKQIVPPSGARSVLHLTARSMAEGDGGTPICKFHHMRITENGIVCAEGIEPSEWYVSPDDGPTKLFRAGDELFAAIGGNKLIALISYVTYDGVRDPRCIVPVLNETEDDYLYYVVCKNDVVLLRDGQAERVGAGCGGSCAVYSYGRLFVGRDCEISYTGAGIGVPFTNEDHDPQGYNTVTLPAAGGPFVYATEWKDELYFFRERGILRLRARGDVFNFRAVELPIGCGAIVPGSVVNCGEAILFCTDAGLFSFDGTRCKRLPNPLFDELYLRGREPQSFFWQGSYYMLARKKTGGYVVFVYDLWQECAHWMILNADSIAGEGDFHILKNKELYVANSKGVPYDEEPCEIELTLSLAAGESARRVEWVQVEGEGLFTVTLLTAGGKAVAEGNAGRRIYLPRVLGGGEANLRLSSRSFAMCIRGVTLGLREDARYDD